MGKEFIIFGAKFREFVFYLVFYPPQQLDITCIYVSQAANYLSVAIPSIQLMLRYPSTVYAGKNNSKRRLTLH